MRRDPRLRGLSSEHHQALVFARAVEQQRHRWSAEDAAILEARYLEDLAPHFLVEEEVLVPALRAAGREDLATRVVREHRLLRHAAASATTAEVAHRFAVALVDHVRFEERELFPACEELLPSAVLDEVARRTRPAG